MPWPAVWRDLYNRYPQARFILTTRNRDSWLRSVLAHFGEIHDPIHQWIYGSACPVGHEESWLEVFDTHNAAVLAFFAAQSSARFLHIAIDDGTPAEDVSRQLCSFLGVPHGPCVWGHVNSLAQRRSPLAALLQVARSIKYKLLGKRSIRLFGLTLTRDYSELM